MPLNKIKISLLSYGFPYLEIVSIAQEASSRQYFRIVGKKISIIATSYPKSLENANDFLQITHFLARASISVPEILYVDNTNSVILQQDVGSLQFDTYFRQGTKPTYHHLEACMKLLAKIHEVQNTPNFILKREFDHEKLQSEIHFFGNALKHLFKDSYTSMLQSILPPFYDSFTELNQRLQVRDDFVFTHRDFHSRNLMVDEQTKKISVIDYQDARMGLPEYDLCSFVFDPYINFNKSEKDRLLTLYRSTSAFKIKLSRFYDMARQRLVKACGTFIYQHCIKENGNYTKFILPVLDEVLAFEVEQDYQKQINYSLIELRTVIEKQLDVKT